MDSAKKISGGYFIYLIIFLGLLSAFGPFVTDMYLPTLPSMADVFSTTASKIQFGLSASMFGLAIGQIFFGPLSDKYGRKNILYISLILFSVSTVMSVYSPNIDFFNFCRFLQGLGGAGGIVMSRSIATDCYSGRELAKTLAIIAAINGIAPVTAPVIGGLVSESIGWKGIFWVLFGIGVFLLGLTIPFAESLEHDKRHMGKVISLLKSFPNLLRNKNFTLWIVIFAFAYGVLFAYISSSTFIVQNLYGYSELTFSLVFAINSTAISLGSALALKFKRLSEAAMYGYLGILIMALSQFLFYYLHNNFIIYEILTFVMLTFLGFIFTSASTMAMEAGRKYIGAASAVLGSCGCLFGGIVSPLVGMGDIMRTTLTIITFFSIVGVLFAIYLNMRLKRKMLL